MILSQDICTQQFLLLIRCEIYKTHFFLFSIMRQITGKNFPAKIMKKHITN